MVKVALAVSLVHTPTAVNFGATGVLVGVDVGVKVGVMVGVFVGVLTGRLEQEPTVLNVTEERNDVR